jgi:hypothetical protein
MSFFGAGCSQFVISATEAIAQVNEALKQMQVAILNQVIMTTSAFSITQDYEMASFF